VLACSLERFEYNPALLPPVWMMAPSSFGKSQARSIEKKMPNSVRTKTQPCLILPQIRIAANLESSNWTAASRSFGTLQEWKLTLRGSPAVRVYCTSQSGSPRQALVSLVGTPFPLCFRGPKATLTLWKNYQRSSGLWARENAQKPYQRCTEAKCHDNVIFGEGNWRQTVA